MDFLNKVVIITGASAGIGASAAVMFAEQSAKIVLVGRNEANLKKVAQECEKQKGHTPLIVKAELTNDQDVKNVISETLKVFGAIDVLVNNAAVAVRGNILEGVEPFERAMNSNMRSVYLLTSLATPYLIESKGNIVNVSSVAAFKPIKDIDFMPYCISKAALDQFTKCLALELGPKGVRVNSVNPGGTRTRFPEGAGFSKEEVDKLYAERDQMYPLRKMAETEDVADVIMFLASRKARSITGSIYVIDNGEILM